MWKLMLLAGAGGFVGTCCRFLFNRFFSLFTFTFPYATFIVNILGCFIFGLLFGLLNKNGVVPPKLYSLLMVGFCGGFTTFSTFSFESYSLGINGYSFLSLFYILMSVLVGLFALWIGIVITR